jgi:pullulanase/glycogen debranching enzyme
MTTTAQVKSNLKFLVSAEGSIAYSLNGAAVKDKAATFVVMHNSTTSDQIFTLPKTGTWSVLVEGAKAGTTVIRKFTGASLTVKGRSTVVISQ